MNLKASKVPFITGGASMGGARGQTITLHDEAGRLVCRLVVVSAAGQGEFRVRASKWADRVCAMLNRCVEPVA